MLSFKRFASLAQSFGADLERWPAEARADARALLAASAEARAIFAAAHAEDVAIGAARQREEQALWRSDDQDAALARLRSGVGARITSLPATRQRRALLGWSLAAIRDLVSPRRGWLGLATSGGVAVVTGFLIGSLPVATPAPVSVLAAFQAMPLHMLTN